MGRRVSRSFAGQFPIFFGLCWSVLILIYEALLKGNSRSGPGQIKGWITLSTG